MAKTGWGKVYFKDTYAGRLQEEPGGRMIFTYDPSYLQPPEQPAVSYSLPLRAEPYVCERGLHPFFDNLVAEGWLQNAQARALGVNARDRFSLLLGFGYDLAGAISVLDPDPHEHKYPVHTERSDSSSIAFARIIVRRPAKASNNKRRQRLSSGGLK